MGKLADVDAPGGNVRGHQHLGLALLEALQRGHTGALALVAVDGGGGDALLGEVAGDLICAVLGAAEHQRVLHRRLQILDEPREQELLVALLDEIQALVDPLHCAGHGIHLDEGGVVEDACGQLLDLFGHRGAEHQVLALCGQLCDDLLHVVHKAHVQHPVGLIQHEDLDVGKVDIALPDEVVQPARAGDEDVYALLDGFHLRGLAHAAENDGAAQFEILSVGGEALADLERKLPGRGEDEGADRTLFAGSCPAQAVEHGQRKGSGLAGAGLGAAHQVPPFQHRRDGRGLNGRGGLIARLAYSFEQGGGQIQFIKSHGTPWSFFDPAALDVIPLLLRMAHAEGLAG